MNQLQVGISNGGSPPWGNGGKFNNQPFEVLEIG